ncbi:MAG TPA: HypC/HybG/HupF family hydrogenase formation chaperone [Dermatophilaceae bacterium]|nr:HypC/HybG/HupF family hydrogenase formation chaperone [Dermatophilaceae bacterium]
MCLGIPGQVVEMTDPEQHLATVDVSGARRAVSVRLLADEGVAVGDWVLVHVGFAMARIDEDEAAETLRALEHLGQLYRDEVDAFSAAVPERHTSA